MSKRAPMPYSSWIAPDGTPPQTSAYRTLTPIFLPSRAPELNPVENVWQYMRQNWLSNRVFDSYDDIIDAACDAWQKLLAASETITSIGMRQWAHVGQTP
ncbi:transposase [Mesorhizobium abyssinicae]